jgi:tRNA dimethylallyltransferase
MSICSGIIIAGATMTGKTAVAVELARLIDGEIISADSRQVYRHLDIGTNKAGSWDAARGARVVDGIPQYLTDLIEPSESFSAGDFVRLAREAMARMTAAGKIPLIVGGTGLYITALTDGLAPLPAKDPVVRAALHELLATGGREALYRELLQYDPVAAEKHRLNPQRLIRALEVCRLTGETLTALQQRGTRPEDTFCQFGIMWERAELSAAINRRSSAMLAGGMVEETRLVLSSGCAPDAPGLQGIGYRSIVAGLAGKLTRDTVEESLQRATRQYAKRQITWFKRDTRITWMPATAATWNPAAVAGEIARRLRI